MHPANVGEVTRRALLSVWDKTGLIPFAEGLVAHGFELISSGGTSAALAEAGIAHRSVDEVTGSPEMLDGRVKTLHPAIHGGILADRSKPTHLADLERQVIAPIDLVVCNLYPFRASPGIDMIDVGGPTMVRGAAKNYAYVGVVVNPDDYEGVLGELRTNGAQLSSETRRRLARSAFAHTASYDAAIVAWFDSEAAGPSSPATLPATLHLSLELAQPLRYGENPHQVGARYRSVGQQGWADTAVQHGGKDMSYLNVYDTDAAWRLVHQLGDQPAAVIVKHANPCGVAVSSDITTAYQKAHEGDPVSAFGGVVALNRVVPVELADALAPIFTEVVIAPGYDPEALKILCARKNLRVLESAPPGTTSLHVRSVDAGMLVQTVDDVESDVAERSDWRVAGRVQPDDTMWDNLVLAWRVVSAVSSNAIVIVNDNKAVGVGAGQQSRVDAARIAVEKAGDDATNAVAASDAFFPFRDGLDVLVQAGVRAVVEPGGSVRDDEVIAAADEAGVALVFTGKRHFRH